MAKPFGYRTHLAGQSSKTRTHVFARRSHGLFLHRTQANSQSFGSRDSVLEVPYLLQDAKDAYTAFLQADAPQNEPSKAFGLLSILFSLSSLTMVLWR